MTLAVRYNNPGNVSLPISNYSGPGTIVGAPGQSGYASFPSAADGLNAFSTQVQNRINQGYNTIASLNSVYAQDPNWKNAVSNLSGIGVNDTLDPTNSQQMSSLQYGIIQQETGNASAFGISPSTPFGGDSTINNGPSNLGIVSGTDINSGDSLTGGDTSAAGFQPNLSGISTSGLGSILSGFQPGTAQGSDSNQGFPLDVTNAAQLGSSAANALSKSLGSSSKQVTEGLNADTSSLETSGTSWLQSLTNTIYDSIARIGVGTLGILLIMIGLIWMAFSHPVTQGVPGAFVEGLKEGSK